MNKTKRKRQIRIKMIIVFLSLIAAASVFVTVWAVFFRDAGVQLTPDRVPQEAEKYATLIKNDTGEDSAAGQGDEMSADQNSRAVNLTYGSNVSIILSNKTAALLFANPGESKMDMVVQVVIQDDILVQSGRLSPGNQVTTLDLLDAAEDKVSPGSYEGKMVVLYYDRKTGEKAIVNTEIPVTVSVVE